MTNNTPKTEAAGGLSAVDRSVGQRSRIRREHPKCPVCGKWMLMHPSSPSGWACKDWTGPLDNNPHGEHL